MNETSTNPTLHNPMYGIRKIRRYCKAWLGKGQVVCHRCQTEAFKFGFNPQGAQRYRCKQCAKTFSDIPERPLDDMRVEPEKAYQVIGLMAEGMGVRACERLTGLNRRTVLGILATAGRKCAQLLDNKLVNLKVEQVQVDEIYSFVNCWERVCWFEWKTKLEAGA